MFCIRTLPEKENSIPLCTSTVCIFSIKTQLVCECSLRRKNIFNAPIRISYFVVIRVAVHIKLELNSQGPTNSTLSSNTPGENVERISREDISLRAEGEGLQQDNHNRTAWTAGSGHRARSV